jgi:hypothetical protein
MAHSGNGGDKKLVDAVAEQVLNARLATLANDPDFPDELKAMIRSEGLAVKDRKEHVVLSESRKLKESDDT